MFCHDLPPCRKELVGSVQSESPGGLYGIALWHLKHPTEWKPESDKVAKYTSEVMAKLECRSTLAWLKTLSELRPEQQASRANALKIVRKGLTILTGTNSVERWLHELQMQELKQRTGKLSDQNLQAAIKLNVQCMTGRRHGSSFNPADLLQNASESHERGVEYRPSPYGLSCQSAYELFYGSRQSQSRSLVVTSSSRSSSKPSLGHVHRQTAGNTFAKSLASHSKTVAQAAHDSGALLSSGPQVRQKCWAEMVQSIGEVSEARQQNSEAGPPDLQRKIIEVRKTFAVPSDSAAPSAAASVVNKQGQGLRSSDDAEEVILARARCDEKEEHKEHPKEKAIKKDKEKKTRKRRTNKRRVIKKRRMRKERRNIKKKRS